MRLRSKAGRRVGLHASGASIASRRCPSSLFAIVESSEEAHDSSPLAFSADEGDVPAEAGLLGVSPCGIFRAGLLLPGPRSSTLGRGCFALRERTGSPTTTGSKGHGPSPESESHDDYESAATLAPCENAGNDTSRSCLPHECRCDFGIHPRRWRSEGDRSPRESTASDFWR